MSSNPLLFSLGNRDRDSDHANGENAAMLKVFEKSGLEVATRREMQTIHVLGWPDLFKAIAPPFSHVAFDRRNDHAWLCREITV